MLFFISYGISVEHVRNKRIEREGRLNLSHISTFTIETTEGEKIYS